MRIDVFSIFPGLIEDFASVSIMGRARTDGLLDLRIHDPRSEASDPHQSVDDAPYGGGAGMVMKPDPVFEAVDRVDPPRPLLFLTPSGRPFDQHPAIELAAGSGFSLLCGRYEGVDQRIRDHLIDDELSLGDYVLSGGEVAAMAVIEAVVRLLPGVMGNDASAEEESFNDGLLEYPHYTRPADFRGWRVPEVLTSGDHGAVSRWRRARALRLTIDRRPDLIENRGGLSDEDLRSLEEFDLK